MAKYPRGNPARWWETRWVGSAHRSPAAMFVSPWRRFSTLVLLVFLLGLIGGTWWVTNPKRISRLAQILLSNVLGGEARVSSGHLSMAGTLRLSGVEVRTVPGEKFAAATTIFKAAEVEVRFDWLSLLVGKLEATQVTAIRPSLNLVEDVGTARWNYEALHPVALVPVATGPALDLPVVVLREVHVQWGQIKEGTYTAKAETVADGQLTPNPNGPGEYLVEVYPRPSGETTGTVPSVEAPGRVTGTWDVAGNRFTAVMENVRLTGGLGRSMPRQVGEWWERHRLSGRLAWLRLSVSPAEGLKVGVEFDGVAMVQEVTVPDPAGAKVLAVPVQELRGTLDFDVGRQEIRTQGLRAKVSGIGVVVTGAVRGMSAEAPFDLQIEVPDLRITERYPDIVLAFAEGRDLVARLRPRGSAAVEVLLRRGLAGAEIVAKGTVTCKDVQARFIHFPYPMDHLAGKITFGDDLVVFHKVTAMAGESPVVLDGYAGISEGNHAVDFTVSSEHTIFDDRIMTCLKPKYREVWQAFDPLGVGRFSCRVEEPKDGGDSRITVDVKPEDVRVRYEGFPFPLYHARGHFVIHDEMTEIEGITAQTAPVGGGTATFKGTVTYPQGSDLGDVQPEVDITLRDAPVERAMLDALPEMHQMWARLVDVTGWLNLEGHLTRDKARDVWVLGKMTLQDGTLAPRNAKPEQAWKMTRVGAELELGAGVVTLKEITGRLGGQEDCVVKASGRADMRDPALVRLAAVGEWTNMRLAPEAPALLPENVRQTWEHYQPAGVVDGDLTLGLTIPKTGELDMGGLFGAGKAAGGKPGAEYMVHLVPRGLALTPAGWPEGLTEMQGDVRVRPGRVEIAKLTAKMGPVVLETHGLYTAGEDLLEVSLTANSPTIPPPFVALLPAAAAGFVNSLHPEATVTLDLPHLARRGPGAPATLPAATAPAGAVAWDFQGSLTLTNLKTSGPVTTSAESVRLSGKGTWDMATAGLDADGVLAARNFVVAGKTIETLAGQVEGRSATRVVKLNGINGKVAGGTLQGDVLIKMDAPGAAGTQGAATASAPAPRVPHYEAKLVLSDAELAALVLPANATAEEKKRIGTGRVTANLAVQQDFGGPGDPAAASTRTGRGELVVRNGTIYDVPLALGLMQVATLRVPVSGSFQNAEMSYYIRDNKVTFEKILLTSPGINLAGAGVMELPNRHLNLRLLTATPAAFRIPIIDPIIQPLRDQMLQFEVTGPVEDPKIQPVPLDALAQPLRRLLPQAPATTTSTTP